MVIDHGRTLFLPVLKRGSEGVVWLIFYLGQLYRHLLTLNLNACVIRSVHHFWALNGAFFLFLRFQANAWKSLNSYILLELFFQFQHKWPRRVQRLCFSYSQFLQALVIGWLSIPIGLCSINGVGPCNSIYSIYMCIHPDRMFNFPCVSL